MEGGKERVANIQNQLKPIIRPKLMTEQKHHKEEREREGERERENALEVMRGKDQNNQGHMCKSHGR